MDEKFNNVYNNPQENNNPQFTQQDNQQYNQQYVQQNPQNYQQQYNQQYGQPNDQPYTQQYAYNQNYPRQYGQPQQYNPPYYNAQYPEYNGDINNNKNGFAIASFVLGLISILFCLISFTGACIWLISFPASIVGLILGIVSLKKHEQGKGMAITGIVTSALSIVFFIIIMIIAIIIAVNSSLYYINNWL